MVHKTDSLRVPVFPSLCELQLNPFPLEKLQVAIQSMPAVQKIVDQNGPPKPIDY